MKKVILTVLNYGATFLLFAGVLSSCSDSYTPPTVNLYALAIQNTLATNLLATTHEGVVGGYYQRGSQAPLQAVLTQSLAVENDKTSTNSAVAIAAANMASAIATYQTKIVVEVDPANLVSQWTFDELTAAAAGDSVMDYSANRHNGALKAGHALFGGGVPALGADRYGDAGKALVFDKGANVEIPYKKTLNDTANMSISVWVKPGEVRKNRFIGLQSFIGYEFEVDSVNVPRARIGYIGGTYNRDAATAINQGTWYHLVMTYTANSMVFYINGVSVQTYTNTPEPIYSIRGTPYNLVLGCDFPTDKYSSDASGTNFNTVGNPAYHVIPAAWGGYLHGSLDEVRIYKSVLTPEQVAKIYTLEKP